MPSDKIVVVPSHTTSFGPAPSAVGHSTEDPISLTLPFQCLPFPLNALPGWIQTIATYNLVTYGVDAARALILDQDVMTVLNVTSFTGIWNTLVPALAILIVLDLAFGSLAVFLLTRATSSDAQ